MGGLGVPKFLAKIKFSHVSLSTHQGVLAAVALGIWGYTWVSILRKEARKRRNEASRGLHSYKLSLPSGHSSSHPFWPLLGPHACKRLSLPGWEVGIPMQAGKGLLGAFIAAWVGARLREKQTWVPDARQQRGEEPARTSLGLKLHPLPFPKDHPGDHLEPTVTSGIFLPAHFKKTRPLRGARSEAQPLLDTPSQAAFPLSTPHHFHPARS